MHGVPAAVGTVTAAVQVQSSSSAAVYCCDLVAIQVVQQGILVHMNGT